LAAREGSQNAQYAGESATTAAAGKNFEEQPHAKSKI
jgi:hypothetical protein